MNIDSVTSTGFRRGAKTAAAPIRRDTAHLVFSVAGQPYACPIGRVQRLLRRADAPVKPGPADAASWEAGVLAGPGEEIPVVSLRALWGLPALAGQAGIDRQALLVAEISGQTRALLVDACLKVVPWLPADTARFRLPPALKGERGRAFATAMPWEKTLLVLLELNDLLPVQPGTGGAPDSFSREKL